MLTWEIWLVALLSLLQSGVYALVQLVGEITSEQGLSASRPLINASRSARPWLDLTYQLLGIAFDLVPVALVCYLLLAGGERPLRVLGIDLRHKKFDLGLGTLLAAVIGIPGLLLYLGAHSMGWAATVVPTNLPDDLGGESRSCCCRRPRTPSSRRPSSSGTCCTAWASSAGSRGPRSPRAPCCAGRTTCTRGSARSWATRSWA